MLSHNTTLHLFLHKNSNVVRILFTVNLLHFKLHIKCRRKWAIVFMHNTHGELKRMRFHRYLFPVISYAILNFCINLLQFIARKLSLESQPLGVSRVLFLQRIFIGFSVSQHWNNILFVYILAFISNVKI